MTIAGFYLCPEGIVLGADSTSSVPVQEGLHYFDFTQKVFEVGENGTLGMVTWGLGCLWPASYRTLIASLADDLLAHPATSISDVAQRWIDSFWNAYSASQYVLQCNQLHTKPPHNPAANPVDPNARTEEEEKTYKNLQQALVVGFCLGGYVMPDRTPRAVYMTFDPTSGKPTPTEMVDECEQWWGVPNIIHRLMLGADDNLINAIVASGKWNGTQADLVPILQTQRFAHGTLPIRDAVDYVHSCIHSTIKAMKFSNMSQVCGGPIEIAVITTDRKFRWVRHKPWDAAIIDGEI